MEHYLTGESSGTPKTEPNINIVMAVYFDLWCWIGLQQLQTEIKSAKDKKTELRMMR